MVDRDILKEYSIDIDEVEKEVAQSLEKYPLEGMEKTYTESIKNFAVGTVLKGRILDVVGRDVIIDSGYKSEGIIPIEEFNSPAEIQIGKEIEVMLESVEDDSGLIKLSKRKADRIRGWEKVVTQYKEGDVLTGRVTRKIKGGLLVDVGVPVFLPASQIDVKLPTDIAEYIGKEVTCKILKIDEGRQNIVVSRRRLLEEQRSKLKDELLNTIEVGLIRKGVVKNIADFGAFIDLGGLDGLLHITDMSWGRISHPSELLAIGDEVEVKILDVDKEKEKIAVGLKQKTENPWINVEQRYPVGSKVTGQVVNIMNYGAFVKLETGIEGLVHISEMSWTRRINHPSEMLAIGDTVEVVVLKINKEKEEISLSIKQTEVNPWTLIEQKYPPGTRIKGRVRNITNYGVFVEIEEGIDGLLHISDLSWAKKVAHPSELVKKGDKIEAVVLSVDREKKRVALGVKQLTQDPWEQEIPEKYHVGDIVRGKITKLTSFGAFVDLGRGLEGLLHVSELSDKKVSNPAEVVSVGSEVDIKIIKIDPSARKIGLSLRMAAIPSEAVPSNTSPEVEPASKTRDTLSGTESQSASGGEEVTLTGEGTPETKEANDK
ncbi:MAG TPA: 30S ribosomal protein S1 [Candidatus Brocadiia bacterium]|nr:30S ribosomal protein S1 [Planctomycetota bacterium]MBI4008400.1 30S ribosomal protein S1 [Planctomycetota bacterium]